MSPGRTGRHADHRISPKRAGCVSLPRPFGRDGHEAARVHRGSRRRGGVAAGGAGAAADAARDRLDPRNAIGCRRRGDSMIGRREFIAVAPGEVQERGMKI